MMARELAPGRRRVQGQRSHQNPHNGTNPGSRSGGGSYGLIFANGPAFFALRNLISRLTPRPGKRRLEAGQDLDVYA